MTIYDSIEVLSENLGKEILTLEEVKHFLKVSGTKDDALISQLIKSAIKRAESLCNLSISDKTYSILFSRSNCNNSFTFPIYKIFQIISVFAKNDCDETSIDSSNYCFDLNSQILTLKYNAYYNGKIKVIFQAKLEENFINFDDLKYALLAHINLLYKRRLASLDSKEIDIEARIAGLYRPLRFFKL
jgi:uncharacterized phiE125 gp8 family phage protein